MSQAYKHMNGSQCAGSDLTSPHQCVHGTHTLKHTGSVCVCVFQRELHLFDAPAHDMNKVQIDLTNYSFGNVAE